MVIIYSHSRLNTFEQCPLKFKYKYIDKIEVIEKSIESFLGSIVHETLDWLYIQVNNKKIPTAEEIIQYYSKNWDENYNPQISILRNLSLEYYFNMGIKFLLDYYTKHYPFDDNTIATEKKVLIDLDEKGEYKLAGFIDRLVHDIKKR